LLSAEAAEKAAAQKEAAEKAAAQKEAAEKAKKAKKAIKWSFSERELKLIEELGRKAKR
jgi:hypothetical protein